MATVTDGQPRSSGRTSAGTGEKPAPAPGAADRTRALLPPRAGAPHEDAPRGAPGRGTRGEPGTRRPWPPPAVPDTDPAEEHSPAAPFRAKPMAPARPHPPGDSPLRFTVPAHASRAALVRRRVTDHLSRLGLPEELCDSVVLATDELFANAVTHTGIRAYDTVTLTMELIRGAVRVMVADPSPVPPLLRTVDGGAESGRGLAIVSVLADAWGVAPAEPGKPGKRVWFTLANPAPSEATP
ncbi:anti-sigma regulatory factor (Ser/Thr protein kinase) [Streptomyces sp. B3I7]|nr:anti-sigma regulatory factor (Ser/Thr protein kinase) [Streptomyces sp. B3I7]